MTSDLPMTKTCWCGCQRETTRGAFFFQGHDKIAEAALNAIDHDDSVAIRLNSRGYGPDPHRSVIAAAVKRGRWVRCERCNYPGRPESVRLHQSRNPNCATELQHWPAN